MDHNLRPNPTLSITKEGETKTQAKAPNSLTADLVHGMQQCRGNTMFWKNLHVDIVSKIVEGQARWGVIKKSTIRSRFHARMHLLHLKAMKGKIEIAPANAIMVFKESEEMAKLKQQEVESGFELFRKFAKIVDPAGNCTNITVAALEEYATSNLSIAGKWNYEFISVQFNGDIEAITIQ
ncbi:hypothetical protein L3X38_025026 [Prunus dulcis]|uniref:Uncharacterized protein n=1 Tax=Prunus dulcis TaxID=3755 RepID=A0AAD4W116_PRUDU|nr:hypothetical protein L3X38_025026 [Prunus dulcis]